MRTQTRNPEVNASHRDGAETPIQCEQYERIFADYLDPVYRYLYSRVGNREDAEDLTSHVFLKASRQLNTARSDASVASWLFTVARTVLADHWRRYYRDPQSTGLNEEIIAEQPADQLSTGGSRATEYVVEAVLQDLPARYRRVLELRFLQGYTVDEAAEEMGVTPGNLRVLQHRALARAAAIGLSDRDAYEVRGPFPVDTSPRARLHDHAGEELHNAPRVPERNMT